MTRDRSVSYGSCTGYMATTTLWTFIGPWTLGYRAYPTTGAAELPINRQILGLYLSSVLDSAFSNCYLVSDNIQDETSNSYIHFRSVREITVISGFHSKLNGVIAAFGRYDLGSVLANIWITYPS